MADIGSFVFSDAQEFTASGVSDNAPKVAGFDDMDVFFDVANDGNWTSVTAVDITVQVSADDSNWADAEDSGGSAITENFTTDGATYVLVDPVPGMYMRMNVELSGSGSTITVTSRGIARRNL